VVIPVYNSAGTLNRALQSVFTQTLPPAQVIVVDDGSRDDPQSQLGEFSDRVIFQSQPNSGAAAARNRAVALADADLIAFLDADDFWHPRKLELQVQAFSQDSNLLVCCTGYRCVDPAQTVAPWPSIDNDDLNYFVNFAELFSHPYLATPTVMVKKAAFEASGGFREQLRTAEDVDLWLRLGWQGAVGRLPCVLTTVVTMPHSTTAQHKDGVFRDNLTVIADFVAAHPEFGAAHGRAVRYAYAKVYEDWGSGALAVGDSATARTKLMQSLTLRIAFRPALLLVKSLWLGAVSFLHK
jgi:GT2 family glycosyltransferase